MYHPIFSNLKDYKLEDSYHQSYSKSLNKMNIFSISILFSLLIVLIYSDLFITENAFLSNNYVFYLRVITASYMISLLFVIRRINDYRFIELNILIMFILMAVVNFVGHWTYPFPEQNIYTKEIMITLLIYLIFPVDLRYQLIGGLLLTMSNFISLDPVVQSEKIYYQTIFLLINCNIVGFFLSRYFHKTMRKLFYGYMQEGQLQTELASKMQELSTYSAVIPICNTCYSVRDDKGFWDNLEHFVSSHTDAYFTHSICPDCSKKMMEELD